MASLCEAMRLSGGGVITLVGAGGKTTLMFRLARELADKNRPVLTTTTTKIYLPRPEESETVIISDNVQGVAARCRDELKHTHYVTAAAGYLADQDKLTGFSAENIRNLWDTGLFQWIVVEADGAAHRSLKAPAPYEPVIPACTRWLVTVVGLDVLGRPLDERWVFRSQIYSRITGLAVGDTVDEDSIVRAILHDEGLMKGCPSSAIRYVFFNKAEDPASRQAGRRAADLLRAASHGRLDAVFIGSARGAPQQLEYISTHEETQL